MDGNQEIMYISRSETQCPNCYGELDSKEKKRGTFIDMQYVEETRAVIALGFELERRT